MAYEDDNKRVTLLFTVEKNRPDCQNGKAYRMLNYYRARYLGDPTQHIEPWSGDVSIDGGSWRGAVRDGANTQPIIEAIEFLDGDAGDAVRID